MSISTPGSVVERASKEFSRRMHSLGFKSAQHSSRYGIIFGLCFGFCNRCKIWVNRYFFFGLILAFVLMCTGLIQNES